MRTSSAHHIAIRAGGVHKSLTKAATAMPPQLEDTTEDTPQPVLDALDADCDTDSVVLAIRDYPAHRTEIAAAHKNNVRVVLAAASVSPKSAGTDFVSGGHRYAEALDELASESIWLLYIAAYAGIDAANDVRDIMSTCGHLPAMPLRSGEVVERYAELKKMLIDKAGKGAVKTIDKRIDTDRLRTKDLLKLLDMGIKNRDG